MTPEQIQKMAEGCPPSSIGKDHEEVVTWLAEKHIALQEQVQKLAAENVDLKSRTVKVPTKAYLKDMRCNVVRWSQVIDALSDAGVAFVRDDGELIAGTRDTPATDAVIREIGAKAVEGFGDVLGLGSLHLALILKKCAYDHAAKLRAGEKP